MMKLIPLSYQVSLLVWMYALIDVEPDRVVLYVYVPCGNMYIYCSITVGEEDEVSIKDVAYMVAEAMDFTGEITVSLAITSITFCYVLNC